MNSFFKKNKAILISFIVALLSVYFLFFDYNEFVKNPSNIIFIFFICWGVLWFLANRFFDVKNRKTFLFKTLLLVGLQIATTSVDCYFNIADNPLTFSLQIIIWVLTVYTFIPVFFFKRQVLLLIFYGCIMVSFVYIRLFTDLPKEQYRIIFSLFLFSIIAVIILWVFEHWKRLQTLKEEKINAELNLLKTQINPHFLFNTLNNLYGLTVEKSDDAPELVLKLSDLLRYTIYHGKKELVLLEQEIEYLKNYIELHKIRYHKNVDIKFDCEFDSNLKIAPLLFIILIENSFKHGVELLTQNAYVYIHLKTIKNNIKFEVENNFKHNKSKTEKGIGLENLKSRLELIYPEKFSLITEKSNSIYKVQLNIDTQ